MLTLTEPLQPGNYSLSPVLDLPTQPAARHPTGKGIFIWNVPQTEGGNVDQIALKAAFAQFDWVGIKIQDRAAAWGNPVVNLDLTQALQGAGLAVWGWGYCYGENPLGEADVVLRELNRLDLAGYFIDAESQYKHKSAQAAAFVRRLTDNTDRPLGLCSYRYPNLHPELPWVEFRAKCDFDMPQVYWMFAHDPEEQLEQSFNEYSRMVPARPFAATGAAYKERGWSPSPGEVVRFLDAAKQLGINGVNFWEWGNCRRNLPTVWDVIKAYPWATSPPPPPPPPPEPFARLRCVKDVRIRSVPDTGDPGNIIGMLFAGDGDAPGQPLYELEERWVGDDIWARIGWKQWSAMVYNGIMYLEVVGGS